MLLTEPGVHGVQLMKPLPKVPAAQSVHADTPATEEKRPGWQRWQGAPPALKRPAWHTVQAVWPRSEVEVPSGQRVQLAWPRSALYWPMSQGGQDDLMSRSAEEKLPAGHGRHACRPTRLP